MKSEGKKASVAPNPGGRGERGFQRTREVHTPLALRALPLAAQWLPQLAC